MLMRSLQFPALAIALMAFASGVGAQNTKFREYQSRDHKIAVKFPSSWELQPPVRNEVWIAAGELRGTSAGCFVRVSVVPNLRLSKPVDYFAQTDEKAFLKLGLMATPDLQVHLYDLSYMGGRSARRVIYSGTDEGTKVGTLMHQTLDGDRIITLACFAEQQKFQLLYGEFDFIAASFRFLK